MRPEAGAAFRRACAGLAVALGLLTVSPRSAAAPSSADTGQSITVNVVSGPSESPGPTSPPAVDCVQTRDADNRPQNTFPERGLMRVFLGAGCAQPHEVDVEIDIASTEALFTHADADGAGGFLTPATRLPDPVLAGDHEVIVKTIDHAYRAPIVVTAVASGGSGPGTQVLGNVITRHLPHTGADIARIVLFALVLTGVGGLLIRIARRRRPARAR